MPGSVRSRPVGRTLLVELLSVAIAALSFLVFALDGLLCIAMAASLAGGVALLGALVGRAIALFGASRTGALATVLLCLPLFAFAESKAVRAPLYQVSTAIVVDALPDAVWPHVVAAQGFELPLPGEWFFRLGIAYPVRARLEGEGVGAVRRCEFSTGAFVEPITA